MSSNLRRFRVNLGKNNVNKSNKKEKLSIEVEQLLSSTTNIKQKLFLILILKMLLKGLKTNVIEVQLDLVY